MAARRRVLDSKASSLNRFSDYWTTPRGKNTVGALNLVAAITASGSYFLAHTYFLDKYRDIIRMYRHGFPVHLPQGVLDMASRVIDDIKLNEKQRKVLSFFTVYGLDLYSIGSLISRHGAVVGLPRSFAYNSAQDVEKKDITVDNKPVEWGSEDGRLLKDALVISPAAKKFGIARELSYLQTNAFYYHPIINAGSIILYLAITSEANKRLYGFYRPRSFRFILYSFAGIFTYGVWAVTKDLISCAHDKFSDEKAASLGLEYAKGGVEYYSKLLQRNIALRSLMGPSGEKRFTFLGNDVEYIRRRHVPLTERKANLEKIAERFITKEI